jgi:hypothetical protein
LNGFEKRRISIAKAKKKRSLHFLSKSPTGIRGLDEITGGASGMSENKRGLKCKVKQNPKPAPGYSYQSV